MEPFFLTVSSHFINVICFCFCLSYAGAEGWKGIRKGNSLQVYNALPLSSEPNLQVTQILQ